MERKEGFLKRNGSALKFAAVTMGSSLLLFVGVPAVVGNITLSEYTNDKQIEYVADELDGDLSYMTEKQNKYTRLQHNGKDPIYVCFDKSLNENEKQCARNALDYMFELVGGINPKYKYKIVDKTDYNLHFLQSRIYFTTEEKTKGKNEKAKGYIDSFGNPTSMYTSKCTMMNVKIVQNRSLVNDQDMQELQYTYLHELVHAFGIDDVYLTDTQRKHYGNTFINSFVGIKTGMLTPNDYKCLISLYAEKEKDDNAQKEAIAKYKTMVEQYEEKYYQNYADKIIEDYEIVNQMKSLNYKWQTHGSFSTSDGKYFNYLYKIIAKDGQYSIEIYDMDNKLIDSATGEAIMSSGVVIFKDVQLKEGLVPGVKGNPNEFIQDLAMVQKETLVHLIDIASGHDIFGITYFDRTPTYGSDPEISK